MIATESVWKYSLNTQVVEIIIRNSESYNADDAAKEIQMFKVIFTKLIVS